MQCSTLHFSVLQCTALYDSMCSGLYGSVVHALNCGTVQCSTVQNMPVRCMTVQCSAVCECSAVSVFPGSSCPLAGAPGPHKLAVAADTGHFTRA